MVSLSFFFDDECVEYLLHAPCMRDVQSGYERCAVEYQSHVREHSGNNNANGGGSAATLGGGNTVADDPVENSKKLCWYIILLFASIIMKLYSLRT